jgi:hypothetical protein
MDIDAGLPPGFELTTSLALGAIMRQLFIAFCALGFICGSSESRASTTTLEFSTTGAVFDYTFDANQVGTPIQFNPGDGATYGQVSGTVHFGTDLITFSNAAITIGNNVLGCCDIYGLLASTGAGSTITGTVNGQTVTEIGFGVQSLTLDLLTDTSMVTSLSILNSFFLSAVDLNGKLTSTDTFSFSVPTPVVTTPLPGALLLFSSGLAVLTLVERRRKKAAANG